MRDLNPDALKKEEKRPNGLKCSRRHFPGRCITLDAEHLVDQASSRHSTDRIFGKPVRQACLTVLQHSLRPSRRQENDTDDTTRPQFAWNGCRSFGRSAMLVITYAKEYGTLVKLGRGSQSLSLASPWGSTSCT